MAQKHVAINVTLIIAFVCGQVLFNLDKWGPRSRLRAQKRRRTQTIPLFSISNENKFLAALFKPLMRTMHSVNKFAKEQQKKKWLPGGPYQLRIRK